MKFGLKITEQSKYKFEQDVARHIRRSEALNRRAVKAGGKLLKQHVIKNMSKSPPKSLKKLREEDHPFARRHGTRGSDGQPWFAIYKRTGRLIAALKGKMESEPEPTFSLKFKRNNPLFPILGTKTMIERDVLKWTVNDDQVRKEVHEKMQRIIKRGI